jgi:hypothetical protein
MGEERDLTGLALNEAADHVVKLVEQQEELADWFEGQFYGEGEKVTE